MKLSEIDRASFIALWNVDDNDLSALGNHFYDYYSEDELIATNSSRFTNRWNLYINPMLKNIAYEIKRWSAIKEQAPTSSRNRNITTKDLFETRNNYTSNHTNNVTETSTQGYQGYPTNGNTVNNAFRKDGDTSSATSNDTSSTTYNSTNNITNTDATSIVNLWEVKEWLDTHYTTTLQDYFNEIANCIFIKFW